MTTNKLGSAIVITIFSFSLIIPTAHAEYYVVCAPPVVHYIDARPACHIKRYHKVRHHKVRHHRVHRHHYVYTRPKSHASISINYYWDMSPPACGCNYGCSTYSVCNNCNESNICYVPASKAYMLDEYDGEFDFDRRTADDIGSDMNIDY